VSGLGMYADAGWVYSTAYYNALRTYEKGGRHKFLKCGGMEVRAQDVGLDGIGGDGRPPSPRALPRSVCITTYGQTWTRDQRLTWTNWAPAVSYPFHMTAGKGINCQSTRSIWTHGYGWMPAELGASGQKRCLDVA